MRKLALLAASLFLAPTFLLAQDNDDANKVSLSGSIQSDMLIPTGDQGTGGTDEDFCTNTYVTLNAISKHLDAGVRFEYLEHPLPGFESDFKGWGVRHFYVKAKGEHVELTAGNFYDQFGSGFIFRTYEERSLGIDNSLLGGRLLVRPYKGIRFKALGGKQRRYWHYNKNQSFVSGADLELDIDQWIKSMANSNTRITLGGSWVNKHESDSCDVIFADETHILNLPEYVNSFDARLNLQHGHFNVLAEYAHKTLDPSFDNAYIYRPGYVAMLSTSYSQKGMSVLLQAKRSDNFSNRSRRSMNGPSSFINHLPAFTLDHTYALAAMYPYATNMKGEWAYQAQLGYQFKRKTALGGRYGMNLKVNFSHVHSIDANPSSKSALEGIAPGGPGTYGYGSAFWKWGKSTYYQDLNVQLERKFSKTFKLSLMYMNQFYNKTAVEGEGGMIHSDIMVADALFHLTNKTTLRTELQYLATKDDNGDWIFGLAELSLAPHWMFTVSDEYNSGVTNEHYWLMSCTYNFGAHRLQAGWGRTKAGYNCSGGVCRYVPESKGFTISYNYNF